MATRTTAILLLASGAALLASAKDLTPADFPNQAASASEGAVIDHHRLVVPGGLHALNPHLKHSDVVNGASLEGAACDGKAEYQTCADTPAFASGMMYLGRNKDGAAEFVGITDRGPNQDCGDMSEVADDKLEAMLGKGNPKSPVDSGKGFPVDKFSPTFAVAVMRDDKTAHVTKSCNLKRSDGSAVTGVSTNPFDDKPYNAFCQAELAYDEGGQDSEDIHPVPGTKYAMFVDEYNPSISVVHFDFDDSANCGKILARYVPENIKLDKAGYKVHSILPASLEERRKNRGFEGLAISPDGKRAMAIMQSPMQVKSDKYFAEAGEEKHDTRDAEFCVTVLLDISNPLDAKVLGMKYYPVDLVATWGRPAKDQDKVKLSSAQWVSNELGLSAQEEAIIVLERDKSVRLYMVDFSVATLHQESTMTAAATHALKTVAKLEAKGIKVAKKTLLFDTGKIPAWAEGGNSNKAEGFGLLNDFTMVLANDNDFGLEGNGATTFTTVQMGKSIQVAWKELKPDHKARSGAFPDPAGSESVFGSDAMRSSAAATSAFAAAAAAAAMAAAAL